MTIPVSRKKFRETQFFLEKLRKTFVVTPRDPEEFDFYLSAFLSAARSVTYFLQKENNAAYESVFDTWRLELPEDDQELLDFMNKQRVAEIHKSGASHHPASTFIEICGEYEDESCKIMSYAPPGVSPGGVYIPSHEFEIGGKCKEAIATCEHYAELIDNLLSEIERFAISTTSDG